MNRLNNIVNRLRTALKVYGKKSENARVFAFRRNVVVIPFSDIMKAMEDFLAKV